MPDVPDDADDFGPRVSASRPESLSKGTLIRPQETRDSLIDDSDAHAVFPVRLLEKPAFN
jgi:hypothetical protein